MPGLAVREGERAADRALLPERDRLEERERLLDVGVVEERQRRLVLRELLAVEVLGVFLLQVRGVLEEDLGELARRRRAVDRPGEALLHEPRHAPDVVEVRVGEDHGRDRARGRTRARPSCAGAAPSRPGTSRSRRGGARPRPRAGTAIPSPSAPPRGKTVVPYAGESMAEEPNGGLAGDPQDEKQPPRLGGPRLLPRSRRGSCPAPSRLLTRAAVKGRWNAVSPSASSAAPSAGSRRSCSSGCRPACRGARAR